MGKVKVPDFFKGFHFNDTTLFSIYIWFFFSPPYYRTAYVLWGHCCFCLIHLKALSSRHKACLDEYCNNLLL